MSVKDKFILHGAPDTFYRCIVITVSFSAHRLLHIEQIKQSSVFCRTVYWLPLSECLIRLGNGPFLCYDEFFRDSRSQSIAHNLSIEYIFMGSTGEPAFSGSSELLSLFTPYAGFLSYLSDHTDTHGDAMLCEIALNGFMACHLTVSSMGCLYLYFQFLFLLNML